MLKWLRKIILPARRAGLKRCLHRLKRIGMTRYWAPRRLGPSLAKATFSGLDAQADDGLREALGQLVRARADSEWAQAWNREAGTLVLLGQTPFPMRQRPDGSQAPCSDPLWLFVFHGWEWAWPHFCQDTARKDVLEAVNNWWQANPMGGGFAWEPYPTSRRLTAWCVAYVTLGLGEEVGLYLARTAHYLARRLERDLDNNHLFVNLKALVFFDLVLPGARDLAAQQLSCAEFVTTLQRHVLPDGGHFEASSGYHLGTWLDALDVALLARARKQAMDPALDTIIRNMEDFAITLLRPDGHMPMLGDSVTDEPLPFAVISALARQLHPEAPAPVEQSRVMADSGYSVLRKGEGNRRTYVCFDHGNLGPDHCPGHGHADMLALEVWSGNQPVLLDSGTYQYKGGERRSYYRSTAAHNTVTVDGLDQVDFVGPFRIGYLGHCKLVDHELGPNKDRVVGEHDGYMRLKGKVTHRREVRLNNWSDLVIVDSFSGSGRHLLELRLHFAPGVTVEIRGKGVVITLGNGTRRQLLMPEREGLSLERGYHSETWFQETEITVLCYRLEADLPCEFQLILS